MRSENGSTTRSRMRGLRVLPLALLLPIISGCATMTASAVPDRADPRRLACGAFAPILWSADDTDQTIIQIKEHNAVGKQICGWAR